MYSFKDGNPRKVHFGNTVKKETLDDLKKQFQEKKISSEDLFHRYESLAFENVEFPAKLSHDKIWKKLTRVQKLVLSMSHFIGQVDNGGLWQFFYNQPMYAFSAYESLSEVSAWVLETRYAKVLEELQDMIGNNHYSKLVAAINNPDLSDEERWKLFQSGKEYLPSAPNFEEYFYEEKNRKSLYDRFIKYLHTNLAKLFHVEVDESAPRAIPKKEAIPYFTNYLKETFKQEPEEVSIYYTGRVTVDNQATQLFLMKFKLPDGWESLGITGYFTHAFENMDWAEVNQMYKRYHKQELVNLYHGWYLVNKAYQKDSTIFEVDEADWKATLAQVQDPQNTQIPVNIGAVRGLRYGNDQWYIYEGDLYYTQKGKALPADLNAVDMSKESGESDILFSTQVADLPSFGGRMSRENPVMAQYRHYGVIGNKHKLLKDNPWGF